MLVAEVGAEKVGLRVELSTEVFQEVRLGRLKVVRLDGVHSLRVVPERYHVVDLRRENR